MNKKGAVLAGRIQAEPLVKNLRSVMKNLERELSAFARFIQEAQ